MCAVQPSGMRNKSFFYDRLLPFLTTVPLLSAWQRAPEENSQFVSVPISGDFSFIHCVLESVCHIARLSGFNRKQSSYFKFLIENSLAAILHNDVRVAPALAQGEVDLLRIAVNTLAIETGNQSCEGSLASYPEIANAKERLDFMSKRINDLDKNLLNSAPFCNFNDSVHAIPQVCKWPLFGRLCRDTGVNHLIGTAPVPAIYRPVELTKVGDKVHTFNDVTVAMRHALNLCVLLANQKSLIRNSYTLRICLIEHLFVRVLPLPLPITHEDRTKKCFWYSQDIRNETQYDILRLLNMLCKHFATASLSVKYTKSGDAIRILTISCMAAICDAVLRKIAVDVPSFVSLHYAGLTEGPVKPFGFDMGKFAIESEYLQFTTPETATARTQVLDYFTQMKTVIDEDHFLFRFDKSNECGIGDKRFINQLCLHNGFPTGFEDMYITGERVELLENYPEIGYFRDLVFTFKLVMVPSSDGLPEVRLWDPVDASFKWSSKNYIFSVQGFHRNLECIYPDIEDNSNAANQTVTDKGIFSKLWKFIGLTTKPRASPSAANPSVLAKERVDSEDDVLHLKSVPNFDETMGGRDSELMLQYLTAPYLRIPLLLNFFANEKRLKSLRCEELQNVLDAAMFEPGRWQEEYVKIAPTQIPAPNRNHLSTPAGLLFNEIMMSPKVILGSIQSMLERVVDMDSGRYSEVSEGILYVLRLSVRVEGYLIFLVKNHAFQKSRKSSNDVLLQGSYTEATVRGIDCTDEAIADVVACRETLKGFLDDKVFRIIARWIKRAKMDGKMILACKLHAHLAFIYRNVEPEELNSRIVFSQLASQIFLANNFKYDLEFDEDPINSSVFSRKSGTESIKNDLGITQIELYDMFQRNRKRMMDWLSTNRASSNEVKLYYYSIVFIIF